MGYKKKLSRCIVTEIISCIVICLILLFQITPVFAAKKADTGYAYLYFYTIDGDEISSLEKKIKVGKNYTFKNPDDYKYIVYKDGDTVIRGDNDDLYDTVKGIEWWDETNTEHIEKYKSGQTTTFDKAGEYYFRVHTDNSAVTGENIAISKETDMVYLSFYDENMDPIETGDEDYTFDTRITTKDTFTFPDPKSVCDTGIYWACTSDNGTKKKSYLFKAGDKVSFNAGDYEFHIATSDPVEISYYYPFGNIVTDAVDPGDQYGQTITAKVGDTITLYKSPGAVVWGCTFKGWIDDNSEDEKIYSGGATFKIMDNGIVHLSMVYEEDENWDPYAKDLNGDVTRKSLMNTSENVNKIGGTGYDTYIDESGKLASKYTPKKVNSKTTLYGIPSTYKEDNQLTSLEKGADATDVGSYTKDKYGYKMEESKITDPNLQDVLKQDNSAYMMDVYGNSMMYHSDLSRLDDMCVAWIRLYEMKNSVPDFATKIQNWDQEEINRFEAIEFALISQEYPGKKNSLYSRFNSNDKDVVAAKAKGEEFAPIADAKLPEWKNEYLSEHAFNMLKYTKTLFTGWADTYEDGVYEAYKGTDGDIHKVSDAKSDSLMERFADFVSESTGNLAVKFSSTINAVKAFNPIESLSDCFTITAYAEKNDMSTAKQYGSHITQSLDNETQVFRRQFFDKSKISRYSSYTFLSLNGLDATKIATLQVVYNYLITNGFSEAMAAGACGNLWQECDFNYLIGLDGGPGGVGGAVGLIQWADGRKTALLNFAASKNSTATSLELQLDYMMYEFNSKGYLKDMNDFISKRANGQTTATVTDVQLATDAWCAVYEGCTCADPSTGAIWHKEHNSQCTVAANGVSYQHLHQRRAYAQAIASAQQAGSSNSMLVQFARTFLGVRYRWGGESPDGFDCSGFARYVLNHFGAGISGTSKELAASAGVEVPIDTFSLQVGDLIFYANSGGTINHVTIYIGNGQIIGANGKPIVKDAKGDYILGEYGEGEVSEKAYNYRTPVRARRCTNITGTTETDPDSDADTETE